MIYDAFSFAKNETAKAISSGEHIRPRGISSHIAAFSSSEKRLIISVSVTPGAMQFTVIPEGAYSFASAFVRPITPAFDAEYTASQEAPA